MRSFQNLSEIISGWLELEEERFWARPTSTKVGTERKEMKVGKRNESGQKRNESGGKYWKWRLLMTKFAANSNGAK